MSEAAAFRATYSDWKLIRTRKCVQIVFEIPVEQSDAAYDALGGMPNPAAEVWCGIARLNLNAVGNDATAGEVGSSCPAPASPSLSPDKHKSWHDMPPSQQAGMLCNEKSFHEFLRTNESDRWRLLNEGTDFDKASLIVCSLCGVARKRDIQTPLTIANWQSLVADYRFWMREAELVA